MAGKPQNILLPPKFTNLVAYKYGANSRALMYIIGHYCILYLQGVVTLIKCVELFVTRIKMKSKDQEVMWLNQAINGGSN